MIADHSPVVIGESRHRSRLPHGGQFILRKAAEAGNLSLPQAPSDHSRLPEVAATATGGTNLGPTSAKLIEAIRGRVNDYRKENDLDATTLIPADAVTSSASGIDPHISPRNAEIQAVRVAKARGVATEQVQAIVAEHVEGRTWGVLGEPRVNVLELNLALDARLPKK